MTVFDPDLGGVEGEFDALLGAYALHALDPDERVLVDRYVERHPDARTEVDDHLETAARLALLSDDERVAPAAVWDAIVTSITADLDGAAAASRATVTDLGSRRTVSARFAGSVGAIAAAVIAVLGFQVADLRGRVDGGGSDGQTTVAAQFATASARTDADVVVLAGAATDPIARIALLPDGTGFLVNDSLEPLAADRTYQLWAVVGTEEKVISVGVLGNAPVDAAFHVSGPVRAFVLTEEVAGGVPQSEGRSVAVSPVA